MSTFPPPPTSTVDWTRPETWGVSLVNSHIRSYYHEATGQWTPLEFVADPYIRLHGLAPGLNYGQQCFEGMKAFRTPGEPGSIVIFRPERHGLRLQHSARAVNMPPVPIDMFIQACRAAVACNAEYVPPHETGCALYLRPVLFASGGQFPPGIPVETMFCVYAFPTSSGNDIGVRPVKTLVLDDFDRAAPRGIGHLKAGGNYAGGLRWAQHAMAKGFAMTLHLDSATREEVDEFSLSGFLGVKYPTPGSDGHCDNSAVTIVVPDSPNAVDSHTSDSIQHIAQSWGWMVEKRAVPYTSLPEFSEVFGVGTAVGIVPVRSITRKATAKRLASSPRVLVDLDDFETVTYVPDGQQGGGPVFCKLLAYFRAIQRGKVAEYHHWRCKVQASDQNLDNFNKGVGDVNGVEGT